MQQHIFDGGFPLSPFLHHVKNGLVKIKYELKDVPFSFGFSTVHAARMKLIGISLASRLLDVCATIMVSVVDLRPLVLNERSKLDIKVHEMKILMEATKLSLHCLNLFET